MIRTDPHASRDVAVIRRLNDTAALATTSRQRTFIDRAEWLTAFVNVVGWSCAGRDALVGYSSGSL